MNLYKALRQAISQAAGVSAEQVHLEHPELEGHGDYSTNIALVLKGGQKLAEQIAGKISSEVIEKVEVAGPGFINIWLKEKFLIDSLKSSPATEIKSMSGHKVVIEYTDPNPFKEFHIGHLISNVTGESLARLHEATGATVRRVDYFGDVGIHVAKSVWGLNKKMNQDRISLADLSQKVLRERVKYMGEGYALGSRTFDEDPTAAAEIGRLNTVLYVAAQRMWVEQGQKPVINYDPEGKIPTTEVDAVYELYTTGRKWSLDYFETIYARLGTKFDGYYPESRVGEIGYELVTKNIGQVFEKSEGAVVFKGEKFGLHTRVFINKHNLPTYEAKELGLAPAKYADFKYDKSIIVVGKEIQEYFKVLVEALTQINPQLGKVTLPICTGMVTVPGGKMSSRKGNVVTVTSLLDDLQAEALSRMKEGDYTKEEKDQIADKIAVGAIKYAFLKSSIGQDIVFDMTSSLSLEGNSGPYLQYTYARTQSVLKKGKNQANAANPSINQLSPEELAVIRYSYRYSEVVSEAANKYAPNLLANFLFELAQRFNTFYNKDTILGNEFRLQLTGKVGEVLKSGLNLLGIEALERM